MIEQKQVDEFAGVVGQAIDHNSFLGDDRMEEINMQGIAKELIEKGYTITTLEWICKTLNVSATEFFGWQAMSKQQSYERFKKYLKSLNLPPEQYEKRLKAWCKKVGF